MRRTRAEVEKVLYLDTDDDFMAIWDEQEAQIRELADALEAVLNNVPACRFVDAHPWDGRCGIHDFTVQEPGKCAIQRASEVLARARGAEMEKEK